MATVKNCSNFFNVSGVKPQSVSWGRVLPARGIYKFLNSFFFKLFQCLIHVLKKTTTQTVYKRWTATLTSFCDFELQMS